MDLSHVAHPLRYEGTTDLAVLLIHGFTSTPASLKDWAEGVHRATGATVFVPLLPGHGTKWQDLNKVTWDDWERIVVDAFDTLAATHRRVAVGGLSLGGALAVLVTLRRPQAVALVLVNHLMWLGNPALPLAPLVKHLVPSMAAVAGDIKKPGVVEPAYDRVPTGGVDQFRRLLNHVRPRLGEIVVPVMIFKSRQDHVIPQASATKTFDRLGTDWIEMVWLEDSYHVATLDNDLPVLVDRTSAFLLDVTSR
jgi:carboxylesterase